MLSGHIWNGSRQKGDCKIGKGRVWVERKKDNKIIQTHQRTLFLCFGGERLKGSHRRAAHKQSSFIFIWGLAEAYWCELEREYALCAWHLRLENLTFVPTEVTRREALQVVFAAVYFYIFFCFFHPTYLVPRTSGVNNRFQFVTTDVLVVGRKEIEWHRDLVVQCTGFLIYLSIGHDLFSVTAPTIFASRHVFSSYFSVTWKETLSRQFLFPCYLFLVFFFLFEIFSKKLACRTTRARPFVLDCWILEIPGPDDDVHRDLFVSGPIARRAIQARHSISVDLQK